MMDPRPAARMAGRAAWISEEMGAKVDRHGMVPELGRDFFDGVALVVGGIVYEDVDGAWVVATCSTADCRAGMSVRSQWMKCGAGQPSAVSEATRACGGFVLDVEEGYPGALAGESVTNDSPMPVAPPVMRTTRSLRLG